jgi:hypothetical protein
MRLLYGSKLFSLSSKLAAIPIKVYPDTDTPYRGVQQMIAQVSTTIEINPELSNLAYE